MWKFIIMAGRVNIEISDDLYKEFLDLKETISLMAKDQISDEDLLWFLVQEISASLEMMAKDWEHWAHDHHHDDWHSCCGGWWCN